MPITDSGVVTIGASVPLAGMYQSVAGQTNPTGYPLNNLRQGTGKYWRASDNTPTTNTKRQLGLLANTKYRSLVGQGLTTYTLAAQDGEHINIQGVIYGGGGAGGAGGTNLQGYQYDAQGYGFPGQPGGTGLSLTSGVQTYIILNGTILGGDGGGGGGSATWMQGDAQAYRAGSGGNGGNGIITAPGTATQATIYLKPGSIIQGGSGGGGGSSWGVNSPLYIGLQPQTNVGVAGNGGGGGSTVTGIALGLPGGGGGGGGALRNPIQSGPINPGFLAGQPGTPGSTPVTGYGKGGPSQSIGTVQYAIVVSGAGGNAGGAYPNATQGGINGQPGGISSTTSYVPERTFIGPTYVAYGYGGTAGVSTQGLITLVPNSQGTVV